MATKGLKTRSVRPEQPLIVRGISSRGENYSTPETTRRLVNPADHRLLPREFTDSVKNAIQGYNYFSKRPASASASSSSLHDLHQAIDPAASVDAIGLSRSMSASNPWTHHSGNTTDRSSLFSEYGEFDREASVKVDHMIREIEKILFGEQKLGIIHTQVEYKDWKKFPHLRIVGSRALPIHDTGYEMTASLAKDVEQRAAENEATPRGAASVSPELLVQGKIIKVLNPGETGSAAAAEIYPGSSDSYSQLEEVFEADGCYEEYLAYDQTRAEDEVSSTADARHTCKQRIAGLPPVTPSSCLNEAIVSLVFDAVWLDTVQWLQPLTSKHYQEAVAIPALASHHLLSLALPDRPPDEDEEVMVEPARREHSESKLSVVAGINPYPAARIQPTAGLGEILHIHHIYPSQKGTMVHPKGGGLVMPGSAHTAVPGRLATHSNRTLSASRRKHPVTGHLKPLADNKKNLNLVPSKQMALQGRSIATPSDSSALLSMPPQTMVLRQPRTLPPIETSDREVVAVASGGGGKHKARSRPPQPRINSAVLDEPHRSFPWDVKPTSLADHRPNTTHTIRGSDLPYNSRRSSTPQAPRNLQQHQGGGGNNSPKVQHRGLVNGITGTGLGIYGSSTHMEINNPYVH